MVVQLDSLPCCLAQQRVFLLRKRYATIGYCMYLRRLKCCDVSVGIRDYILKLHSVPCHDLYDDVVDCVRVVFLFFHSGSTRIYASFLKKHCFSLIFVEWCVPFPISDRGIIFCGIFSSRLQEKHIVSLFQT